MIPENDFNAFIEQYKGKILRYWKYKRPGIKYNWDGEMDVPGPYVEEKASMGFLVDATPLPGYDLLLAFKDPELDNYIDFVRLSEIDMAYTDFDQRDLEDE